jgi:two-component system phosphate regulon sensor histidine kinase PhoR
MNSAVRAAIAFFLVLGALPVLLFALLIGAGALQPMAGLIAGGVCLAVAVGFGLILGRDVAVMAQLLRALRQQPEAVPGKPRFFVPGMRKIGQETILLLRTGRLRQARLRDDAAEDRALVERLPDPLMKLDAAGNVTWRNASAAHAFGQESAALLRHPEMRAALAEAARTARPVRKSIALAAPVPRDLDITLIPVGAPVYLLISDRTRERSLEKMRADFAANSSHELRTPLASLIGFIETLRGPAANDPTAQQHFLGIMAEQAMRMQRLIEDLLSLSRIEISEHQPPDELLLLPAFLERIAAAMEPVAKAGGARIDLAVADRLPAVSADADQLTQVFNNLLDNAVKYGKRGGRIWFTAAPAGIDARFDPHGVIIVVADEGGGIAREHIPRLTERFYRVDKGRSRAVGGTGLGLAIVKHVVNRHRGRLVIDSVEGQGTKFIVWLPMRQDT